MLLPSRSPLRVALSSRGAECRHFQCVRKRQLVATHEQLERENARLRKRLETAETILELQGSVSRLLGLTMPEWKERTS